MFMQLGYAWNELSRTNRLSDKTISRSQSGGRYDFDVRVQGTPNFS